MITSSSPSVKIYGSPVSKRSISQLPVDEPTTNHSCVINNVGGDLGWQSSRHSRLQKEFETPSLMANNDGMCCNSNKEQCKSLELANFSLSIATSVSLGLLAIHLFTVQLAGLAILPLIGSLVFLYLVVLLKKSTTVLTISGCVAASACVILFSSLILVVWSLNWHYILDHENYTDVSFWSCPKLHSSSDPSNLSSACVVGHAIMGALAIIVGISAVGVLISSATLLPTLLSSSSKPGQELFPAMLNGTMTPVLCADASV